jgi:hypothetical protein
LAENEAKAYMPMIESSHGIELKKPDLQVAQVAHFLDDARQPERRGVDGQLDAEVDQAEQQDLAVLEQFAQGRFDRRRGFAGLCSWSMA